MKRRDLIKLSAIAGAASAAVGLSTASSASASEGVSPTVDDVDAVADLHANGDSLVVVNGDDSNDEKGLYWRDETGSYNKLTYHRQKFDRMAAVNRNEFPVDFYGADPTGQTSSQDAWNEAYAACVENGGGEIILGTTTAVHHTSGNPAPGYYNFSDGAHIEHGGVIVRGYSVPWFGGRQDSILPGTRVRSSNSDSVFGFNMSETGALRGLMISGIMVEGTAGQIGFNAPFQGSHITYRNCLVRGARKGWYLGPSSLSCLFDNCSVSDIGDSGKGVGWDLNSNNHATMLLNCRARGSAVDGTVSIATIRVGDGGDSSCVNIIGGSTDARMVNKQIEIETADSININNWYAEAKDDNCAILIDVGSSGEVNSCTVKNSYLIGNGVGKDCIRLRNVNGARIMHNRASNFTKNRFVYNNEADGNNFGVVAENNIGQMVNVAGAELTPL